MLNIGGGWDNYFAFFQGENPPKEINCGSVWSKVCGIGPAGFPLSVPARRQAGRFRLNRQLPRYRWYCRITTKTALQSPIHSAFCKANSLGAFLNSHVVSYPLLQLWFQQAQSTPSSRDDSTNVNTCIRTHPLKAGYTAHSSSPQSRFHPISYPARIPKEAVGAQQ